MELNPELELVELVLTVDDLAFIVPPATPDCTGVTFCSTHKHKPLKRLLKPLMSPSAAHTNHRYVYLSHWCHLPQHTQIQNH